MKDVILYDWHISPSEAVRLQQELASEIITTGAVENPRFIAGADMSVAPDRIHARAVIVVLNWPELEVVELVEEEGQMEFPYIPGLLSFREAPLVIKAWEKLATAPDLLFVDGQGYAHPRRMGIASHLGLLLDVPTIGCAKSRLCGEYAEPGQYPGNSSALYDRGELIGQVLRTKEGSKPLFISVGHKISLENAVYWVMKCLRGRRLPEPARLAHLASIRQLKVPVSKS